MVWRILFSFIYLGVLYQKGQMSIHLVDNIQYNKVFAIITYNLFKGRPQIITFKLQLLLP